MPLTRLPRPVRKGLGGIAKRLPKMKGKNFLIRGSKDLQERFIGNAWAGKRRFDFVVVFVFFQPDADGHREAQFLFLRHHVRQMPVRRLPPHTELTKPYYDKVRDLDDVTKMQYIDIHFWLIGDILLKADKMSMAHSLEVRVPFLDRAVFDVAKNSLCQTRNM